MAKVAVVKEVVAVKKDKVVEVEQEVEIILQTIMMLHAIAARKKDILPISIQNWHQYQKTTIEAVNF